MKKASVLTVPLTMMLIFLAESCAVQPPPTPAPTWKTAGTAGFSQASAQDICLAVHNGTPYIAYQDVSSANVARVMKYNGSAWISVGSGPVSDGDAYDINLDILNGQPLLVYKDSANGGGLTARVYNGSSWVNLGINSFTPSDVGDSVGTRNIALQVKDATPYVAFSDGNAGDQVSVMYYDGTNWQYLLSPGFSSAPLHSHISLVLEEGRIYTAFCDSASNDTISVYTTNGSSWVRLQPDILADNSAFACIGAYQDTLYMLYQDGTNSWQSALAVNSGSGWVRADYEPGSLASSDSHSLAIYSGEPYVLYPDASHANRATLKRWNGTQWTVIGDSGFSSGSVSQVCLQFSGGVPWAAFSDADLSGRITVMVYR